MLTPAAFSCVFVCLIEIFIPQTHGHTQKQKQKQKHIDSYFHIPSQIIDGKLVDDEQREEARAGSARGEPSPTPTRNSNPR